MYVSFRPSRRCDVCDRITIRVIRRIRIVRIVRRIRIVRVPVHDSIHISGIIIISNAVVYGTVSTVALMLSCLCLFLGSLALALAFSLSGFLDVGTIQPHRRVHATGPRCIRIGRGQRSGLRGRPNHFLGRKQKFIYGCSYTK